MERNIIINGDSLQKIRMLPDESVDLVFADPPYWMRVEGVLNRTDGTKFNGCEDHWDQFDSLDDYERFTRAWLTECRRVLKKDGSIWVIGGMQCIYTIGAIMQELGFWLINDVIWYKKNPTPNFMGTRLNNSHETLIWAAKSKTSKFTFHYKTAKELNTDTVDEGDYQRGVRKQLGSVWRIAVCSGNERIKTSDGQKLHSTQKPEELLERIITISSNKGDLIMDPFGGTMTTAAVAKRLGRNYIMIEREKTYCEYGATRLKKIAYIDTPLANAAYDIKPPKVTMDEMMRAGYFHVGESFYLKKGDAVATLNQSGKLKYQGSIMDMHSCAAAAKGIKAKRVNGFDYWYVMRDEHRIPIREIREAYRKFIA